jgi:ABC-type polysaccharide/polyol phosphate export permease
MFKITDLKSTILDIWVKKRLIFSLSINDFKKKYSNSYLGLCWSFIQPLINIGVFWFVFSVGFRAADIEEGIPFILWLVCGLIPWYYFSDVLIGGSNVLYEYSYMLKQMVFRPGILPFMKIFSSLITHMFFIILIIIIAAIYKFPFSIYYLQIIYYIICSMYLLLGLVWLTSSLKVFLPDTSEIIGVVLQIGLWVTPIMWNVKMIPEKYQWIIKLNPIFYIVNGYRDTFINKIWFWERYTWVIYYFTLTSFLFVLGALVFKKLQPHFNDVL